MTKKDILLNFMSTQKFTVSIDTTIANTGLTKKDILLLLRKTYKVHKPNKNEDYLLYAPNGILPMGYDDLIYNRDEPNNTKQNLCLCMLHYQSMPSIEVYNHYCEIMDRGHLIFIGSSNSYHSMKRDLKIMLIDNNLLTI